MQCRLPDLMLWSKVQQLMFSIRFIIAHWRTDQEFFQGEVSAGFAVWLEGNKGFIWDQLAAKALSWFFKLIIF